MEVKLTVEEGQHLMKQFTKMDEKADKNLIKDKDIPYEIQVQLGLVGN